MDCPDPSVWLAWSEGRLPGTTRARWGPHLASCAGCRAELGALASPARRSPLPFALAAGLLLALAGFLAWQSGGKTPAPAPVPPAAGIRAEGEILLGAAGEAVLAPGSLARTEGATLRLERGGAWVEARGEEVRLEASGMEGWVLLKEGRVSLVAAGQEASLLLREARAGEGWGLRVVEGEAEWVRAEGRLALPAGTLLGRGAPGSGPSQGWRAGSGGRVRQGVLVMAPGLERASYVAEALIRKGDREAEAAILFRAGGRGWQVPLGVHLPVNTWVRVRVEVATGSVRIWAGGRSILSETPERLALQAYPVEGGHAWAVKAWGGDLEARGARWR